MATAFLNNTDLYRIYNVIQNSFIRYPKDLVIGNLKEFFAKDSLYHFVRDSFGFPKVVNHLNLPPEAGLNDDLCTRVYIGETYKADVIYYPSILVKFQSAKSVPISMNRETGRVDYDTVKYTDGYSNTSLIQVPSRFVLAGSWEGSLSIEVSSRGIRERDDIIELIAIFLADLHYDEFQKSGLAIRPNSISVSSPSEMPDRNNQLFRQSITFDFRTEWKKEIPVLNIIDQINFCVDIGNLQSTTPLIAPNLTISTNLDLLTILENLV